MCFGAQPSNTLAIVGLHASTNLINMPPILGPQAKVKRLVHMDDKALVYLEDAHEAAKAICHLRKSPVAHLYEVGQSQGGERVVMKPELTC